MFLFNFRIGSVVPASLLELMVGFLVLDLQYGLDLCEPAEVFPLEAGALLQQLEDVQTH